MKTMKSLTIVVALLAAMTLAKSPSSKPDQLGQLAAKSWALARA